MMGGMLDVLFGKLVRKMEFDGKIRVESGLLLVMKGVEVFVAVIVDVLFGKLVRKMEFDGKIRVESGLLLVMKGVEVFVAVIVERTRMREIVLVVSLIGMSVGEFVVGVVERMVE